MDYEENEETVLVIINAFYRFNTLYIPGRFIEESGISHAISSASL
jgi:hypothetical protein